MRSLLFTMITMLDDIFSLWSSWRIKDTLNKNEYKVIQKYSQNYAEPPPTDWKVNGMWNVDNHMLW